MKRLVPLVFAVGDARRRISFQFPESRERAKCRIGEFGFEPHGA